MIQKQEQSQIMSGDWVPHPAPTPCEWNLVPSLPGVPILTDQNIYKPRAVLRTPPPPSLP